MFKRVVNLPEFNIAVFAFLLNFIWEMFQAPLFRGLKEAEYVVVLRTCLWATFGDVAIAGASFWMVAWIRSDGRDWMMNPKALGIIGFTAAGLVTTVLKHANRLSRSTSPITRPFLHHCMALDIPLRGILD